MVGEGPWNYLAWRIWQTIVKGVRSLSRVEKGWHSPQKSSESCLTIQAYARLVYANLFSSSLHTHTHGKGGDVNPARLPKFNAPLVFSRRVSATARASADAALAPRIRFLLLYFSLDRFYPPRSPIPSCLLVSWRAVLVPRAQASPVLLHPIGSRFFLIFPLAFFCFLWRFATFEEISRHRRVLLPSSLCRYRLPLWKASLQYVEIWRLSLTRLSWTRRFISISIIFLGIQDIFLWWSLML